MKAIVKRTKKGVDSLTPQGTVQHTEKEVHVSFDASCAICRPSGCMGHVGMRAALEANTAGIGKSPGFQSSNDRAPYGRYTEAEALNARKKAKGRAAQAKGDAARLARLEARFAFLTPGPGAWA